jgi:hypothetical protein
MSDPPKTNILLGIMIRLTDELLVKCHMMSDYNLSFWKNRYQGCNIYLYCDEHAVGQQSTVRRLFTAVAMQRNNGSDQRFLCGPFRQ